MDKLLASVLSAAVTLALEGQQARAVQVQAPPGPSAAREARVALVIGNGAYRGAPLRNPVNDARAVAAKLRQRGFEVILKEDLEQRQIGGVLREFRARLVPGAQAVFYYAGHGLQVNGVNYLPAVDAEILTEEDVPNQSLSVQQVLELLDGQRTRLNLVFLDACRVNPFLGRSRGGSGGLARVNAPSGTILSFATRPGSLAADGDGNHGLYTAYLLKAMDAEGVPIELALKQVLSGVKTASGGRQEPWIEGGIEGDFFFRPGGAPAAPEPAPAPVREAERPSLPTVPGAVWRDPEAGIDFILIPAGRFQMGSTNGQFDEKPVHAVTLSRPFLLQRTPVTVGQFRAFVEATGYRTEAEQGNGSKVLAGTWELRPDATWRNPYYAQGDESPVVCVSWNDAQAYLRWLNANATGTVYRLPTEAEWEYACRAGRPDDPYGPLDAIAWYSGNSGNRAHPVAQKRPNPWGLYDMIGNVWQWCQDWWAESYVRDPQTDPQGPPEGSARVYRGGSWGSFPKSWRAACRAAESPELRASYLGFRVLRVLP